MGTFSVTYKGVSARRTLDGILRCAAFLSCIKKITELKTGQLLKILPREKGLNKASAPIPNEITRLRFPSAARLKRDLIQCFTLPNEKTSRN